MVEDGTRRRRARRAAVVPLLILLVLLLLLWSARKPIARHFVDRSLAERGVAARYEIRRLGVLEQQLDNLVIGDPAAPDLTADRAVIRLGWGLSGPVLRGVRASGVRLRGKLIDGRLSLGAIDRLLPKPGNAPFALPDLDVDLDDARMRLDTSAGAIGLSLRGTGNLADGFAGTLAAVASTLALGDCRSTSASAFLSIQVRDRAPSVTGPVRVGGIDCGARGVARDAWAQLAATLSPGLDRWRGAAGVALVDATLGANRVSGLRGRIDFAGSAAATRGSLALAGAAASDGATVRRLAIEGRYAVEGRAMGFDGTARATGASIARERLRPLLAALSGASGTPVAPIAQAISDATGRAARRFDADAALAIERRGGIGQLRLARFVASSASGAHVIFGEGAGAAWRWGGAPSLRLDGVLRLAGGGLPDLRLAARQSEGDAGPSGQGEMAPYAAGGARLALAAIRFGPLPGVGGGGVGGVAFAATPLLDGPLADGRVAGLSLPLSGRAGAGGLLVNPGCAPLTFASLAIAGTRIGPSRLTLCPTGPALLVRRPSGRLTGGGAIAGPRLTGSVGAQPLLLAASALRVDVGRPGFTLDRLAARLGAGEGSTRLDVPLIEGTASRDGLAGRFTDASGQIANVPLLLSAASGGWRLAGGVLALEGGLAVSDAAAAPRFHPLAADGVKLTLKGGAIAASAILAEPKTRRAVAAVTLRHDLRRGEGGAVIDVQGLTFDPRLQPEALTPLTVGVVANVVGRIAGQGRIAWGRGGVASSGDFRTDALDLAAAFGPVTGIKGTIHFSDLLGLTTPPGQTVTLGAVNPGVEVQGGVVRYQLLGEQRIRIEGGRWEFAGGVLTLEPTILDFGQPVERRFTFTVSGLDAAEFIERFKLDNIAATGRFDGTLPILFDQKGGRIEGGRLVVRQGGGRLSYVGDVSNADLGTFGKLAFDALKSIRYEALAIDLDGALDGELISRIAFTGVNDRPVAATPAKGITRSFTGLPFKFNIVVRAPFRGLLDSASTFANPAGALQKARPVQGQESGDAP